MDSTRRCLILFARSPREEGSVKRIRRANRLFRFVQTRMRQAAKLCGVDLVEVSSERPEGAVRWLPQRGSTFAERVRSAFDDARALGYETIVAVPIDVPGLSANDLTGAFDRLRDHDHVLGPSPDGGVYLIGARVDASPLLDGVRWNTAFVFNDLLERTSSVATLRLLRDLDRPSDLIPLRSEVEDFNARAIIASLTQVVAPQAGHTQPAPFQTRAASAGRAPPLHSRP